MKLFVVGVYHVSVFAFYKIRGIKIYERRRSIRKHLE